MHNDLWQRYHPNGAPKQGEGCARKDITKDTIVAAAHVWLWRRSSDGVTYCFSAGLTRSKTGQVIGIFRQQGT